MNDVRKAKQVIDNCVGCGSEDIESCVSFQDGLITDCIEAIIVTDVELALAAGIGQGVIDKIKERILRQATEWKGLDHENYSNKPSIFKDANGNLVTQQKLSKEELDKLKQEPWWDEFIGDKTIITGSAPGVEGKHK